MTLKGKETQCRIQTVHLIEVFIQYSVYEELDYKGTLYHRICLVIILTLILRIKSPNL